MSEPATTRTLANTTIVLRWVERDRAELVIRSSDAFQMRLAAALAAFSGAVPALIALATGLLHPDPMYVIVCSLLVITALLGFFAWRSYAELRMARSVLEKATVEVPIPLSLVSPGTAPMVTSYGLGQGTSMPVAAGQLWPVDGTSQPATASVAAPPEAGADQVPNQAAAE